MEKWLVHGKKADFNGLSEKFGITPVLARIIRNRDIIEEEQYREYLECNIENMNNPLLYTDMEKAVGIIERAIVNKQHIRVIGDYDIDGICAGYILTDGLENLSAEVDFDVPERINDGYGINERLIRQAYDDGVKLIITCDNGIAAKKQVDLAKSLGMNIIITDHHEVPYEFEGENRKYIMPEADAVIDHKRPDDTYPFKELCGAGVAYKLLQVLYESFNGKFGKKVENKYLTFAAVATIGDIVPLVGENRTIVKNGMKNIKEVDNYGLRALIEVNGLTDNKISSYHISFVIGPCINAGGRLDTAKRAYALFRSENYSEALQKAQELKEINEERKNLTLEYTKKAMDIIEADEELKRDKVLILYLKECHESLAGIIAGKIKEQYYKPSIVFTDCKEGIKGSGRSVEGYSMFEELSLADNLYRQTHGESLFVRFGGHKMAAGISMEYDKLTELRRILNESRNLNEDMLIRKIWIDVPLPFEYITERLIKELEILEPFGMSNEKPVFAEKCTGIERFRIFGKNRNVISMLIRNKSGYKMEATYFEAEEVFIREMTALYGSMAVNNILDGKRADVKFNILYYPEINEYNGNKNIRVVIKRFS